MAEPTVEDAVILSPGDPAYRPGLGCGYCHRDDVAIILSGRAADENARASLGDKVSDGICLSCCRRGAELLEIFSLAPPAGGSFSR